MAVSPVEPAPTEIRMALPPGVVANAAYECRVPEPPSIAINVPFCYDNSNRRHRGPLSTHPSPDRRQRTGFSQSSARIVSPNPAMASAVGLTPAQVHEITGDRSIEAPSEDLQNNWDYKMRYQAQPVLDYLYLGPYTAVRNGQFLTDAGITMLLVVRDTRLVMARLLDMGKVAQTLGLALHSVDVSSPSELIQELPGAVKAINDHMLGASRDKNGVSTGRVLVLCETGNGRSACVASAYVMAMYGLSLADALAFVNHTRFCMSLDEDAKNMLMSYGDILLAQSDVARHADTDDGSRDGPANGDKPRSGTSPAASRHPRRAKRGIEDTMETDENSAEGSLQSSAAAMDMGQTLDRERFQNRGAFTPFCDADMA